MCDFFDIGFFRSLVATLVGVTAGVPAALLIDKLIRLLGSCGRKRQLTATILAAMRRNVALLDQLEGEIGKLIPTYSMDVTVLEATSYHKYELLEIKECEAVDKARYQLLHLNDQLGQIRAMAAIRPSEEYLKGIQNSCTNLIPLVRGPLNEAIAAIGGEGAEKVPA